MHEERFDAKQVVVSPSGDGVRIREVVDQDFGNTTGTATSGSSPTTSARPPTSWRRRPTRPDQRCQRRPTRATQTRIRIGDPDTTIDGQHRYVLAYTLPDAQLSSGQLALDIIGAGEELETGRFEVVLTGFELTDTTCNVGAFGTIGGCELVQRRRRLPRGVRAAARPGRASPSAAPSSRITAPVDVPIPELPTGASSHRLLAGAGARSALGVLAGVGGVPARPPRWVATRSAALGAADAAYGAQRRRPDATGDRQGARRDGHHRVRAAAGMRPWQGALLLTRRSTTTRCRPGSPTRSPGGDRAAAATPHELVPGPKLASVAADHAAAHRDAARRRRPSSTLGTLPAVADHAVEGDRSRSRRSLPRESGWWKQFAAGHRRSRSRRRSARCVVMVPAVGRLRCLAGPAALRGRSPCRCRVRSFRRWSPAWPTAAAAAAQCGGQRARAAGRVVPPLPGGQRGQARRLGLAARPAARVLGVGRRPRCGRRLGSRRGRQRGAAARGGRQHDAAVDLHPRAAWHASHHAAVEQWSSERVRWRLLRRRRRVAVVVAAARAAGELTSLRCAAVPPLRTDPPRRGPPVRRAWLRRHRHRRHRRGGRRQRPGDLLALHGQAGAAGGDAHRRQRAAARRRPGSASTAAADAEAALAALVHEQVAFALDQPDLIVVHARELRHLDTEQAHRVRLLQRQYVDVWVDVMQPSLPDVPDDRGWRPRCRPRSG